MSNVDIREPYLDLLMKSLSDILNEGGVAVVPLEPGRRIFFMRWILNAMINGLAKRKKHIVSEFNYEERLVGKDWPMNAKTMIGLKRLNNVKECVQKTIEEDIPGDFIETGVWRGGACILARAAQKVYGGADRNVWVADSFAGLPKADLEQYPADGHLDFSEFDQLRVSMDDVKANFEQYGLLDDHIKFLKGWFKDTLPDAPIDKLAVMRLDGDMYESTMDALKAMYPKLSVGGYCIIDDLDIPACAKAVQDYRKEHGIEEEIVMVDWTGGYWKRTQ